MMKNAIILLVIFIAVLAVGCDETALSPSGGAGVVDSKAQRRRRVASIMDLNDHMVQDDFDEIWLIRDKSTLMEWEVFEGE